MNEESPKTLSQTLTQKLIGHQKPWEILEKTYEKKRLPHAFCFCGADGIGKKTFALQWLARDFCERVGSGKPKPCGKCAGCRKFEHGNHPDFLFLEAEGKSIKIDSVRHLIRQTQFRPLVAPRRWVLIHEAEKLTEQAQNALLHTLEEPPRDTHFILLTQAFDQLLQTVRSRCQVIRFPPLSREEVSLVLQAQGFSLEEAQGLSLLANGCPGRVVQWTQDEILSLRKEILSLFSQWPQVSSPEKRKWNELLLAQKLSGQKKDFPIILEIMQSFFRDLALYRLGRPPEEILNQDLLGDFPLWDIVPITKILSSFQRVSRVFADFKINTQPELTFHETFFEIDRLLHS